VQVPVRLVAALRPNVHPAVLLAVGVATVVFTASPFLIDDVAEHYELGLTASSLISTGQLGGFGLASMAAGRVLAGRRHVFVTSSLLLVVLNLASAAVPPFWLLVLLRSLAGLAMGVTGWLAWALVFGDDDGTSDVSMMGPLVGIIAAPMIAPVVAIGGIAATYLLLAAVALLPPLAAGMLSAPRLPPAAVGDPDSGGGGDRAGSGPAGPVRIRHRPVRAAMVLLLAMALFSLGGSSVWMFTAVLGEERGLSLTALAWAYSGNAVAGVIASRWPFDRGPAGAWMASTGVLAVIVSTQDVALLQLMAMVLWGFCFWMGMPGAFRLLAAKSRYPAERAGDAQGFLSGGRVIGPFVGGLTIEHFGAPSLGYLAAAIMIGSGLLTLYVARPEPTSTAAQVGR